MITIVIPGNAVVKKNTAKTSMFYKNKQGARVARAYPIHYYSKAYKEWALKAIVACQKFKQLHHDFEYPLQGQWNMRCRFYFDKLPFVDLSALYEAPQDIIAGSSGISNIEPAVYQIIEDDNIRFIASHDGSRVLLDYINPRTEIVLTPFILKYEG